MKFYGWIVTVLAMMQILVTPSAFAVDTSIGVLSMSGTVPVVFSLQVRGVPGDLDLSPNVIVNGRRVGLIHFKINQDVDHIWINTDNTTGFPHKAGVVDGSGDAPVLTFKFAVGASPACTVASFAAANVPITAATTEIATAAAQTLTVGKEEDCSIDASWTGATNALPLSGRYEIKLTVTMISK